MWLVVQRFVATEFLSALRARAARNLSGASTTMSDEQPLLSAGMRMIEFTHVVMGPAAGLMLADLGADVIKLEPTDGDKTRSLTGSGAGCFPAYNRNKRLIYRSEKGFLAGPYEARTAMAFSRPFCNAISLERPRRRSRGPRSDSTRARSQASRSTPRNGRKASWFTPSSATRRGAQSRGARRGRLLRGIDRSDAEQGIVTAESPGLAPESPLEGLRCVLL